MAKLTILAAALVALIALAQATRTTITTTVVEEEENPRQQQRCRQQIQREDNLRDCQMYLQQQMRGGYDKVAMITETNPHQQLRMCCQQMENLDEQCRCEGLMEAMRQQRGQGQMQEEEMREMMQQAENLPSKFDMATLDGGDNLTLPDDFLEDKHLVELESVNDPNNEDLLQNKSCQPFNFGYGSPLDPCEGMIFDELEEAETRYKAYARRKVLASGKVILDCLIKTNH
ncbi:hypothetical protein Vadar_016611 [Vaccinium darrowii]|uniref:Uncharacterized protein n=1 Tax=Vaccinium darrowii TaxID=229202 RepID=A0ACB7XAC6_9ERIC|nr:hypothetical protein Vadar_016611 [Vaccinium darrowii]